MYPCPSDPVVFVPYTPGGKLAQLMREKMKEVMYGKEGGFRIVERVGVSMEAMLKKSDPFKEKTCGRAACLMCKFENCGDCEKEGVGYEIWCNTCKNTGIKKIYSGESSNNGFTRGGDHEKNCTSGGQSRTESSFMWKHQQNKHRGEDAEWGMRALRHFVGDPVGRTCNEQVRIDEYSSKEPDSLLNSRSEHHQTHIPRLMVV